MSSLEEVPNQRWITRAKLDAPVQQVREVERTHLLAQLDLFLEKRLGLIVAPAGFGKSTLMAQWRDRQRSRRNFVAWLSLDEADSEPLQLFSYLVVALERSGVELGSLVKLAEQGLMNSMLRSATSAMLESIAQAGARVVLILDDYHRVSGPAVDRLMNTILGAAPHNFTIILASRHRPNLDLPRLLAAGVASEIDADALRISRAEIETVLDPAMEPAAMDLLHARTEGWPVAIQLARFLLQSENRGLALLEMFKGDSGHIAAYLTDQVLCSISEEERLFLLQTSILERFNAPLADAATGRTDSRDMLARLGHLNALLVPLAEPAGWFRYHHLFAEYLQGQLQRDYSSSIASLHLKASLWFEENEDLADAVRHAREAGDLPRCAALIEQAGGWELILFGGIGYLRNLLGNIPPGAISDFPRSQIALAYLYLKDGRLAEARSLFEVARDAGRDALDDGPLARDLLNVGALLDGYEDKRTPAVFDRLAATIAKQRASDPMTIAILTCEQSLTALALGRIPEAEVCAQEAMRSMRRARTILGLTYSTLHAGLAALYQGRFSIAEAHFGAACRMALDNFASDPGLKAQSHLLVAVLAYWRGKGADRNGADFRSAIEHVEAYDGWFELYANGLQVECDLANEGPAEAITRARRIAADRGLRRLELLADVQSLLYNSGTGGHAVARQLQLALPQGIWRRDPFLWRPFVASRLALARHLVDGNRAAAVQGLDDALECCRTTGATIFLIDTLAARAAILDRSGDRTGALADLIEALSMAAPEHIARPFIRSRDLVPLLRTILKTARSEYIDVIVTEFAKDILSMVAPSNDVGDGGMSALSAREREVFEELVEGRSNKEIARSLGMTENTVKFHLKHIFLKLEVQNRGQAIAQARPRPSDPPYPIG